MAEATEEKTPEVKTISPEELKAIWQRLSVQAPDGCKLTLFYKAHFGVFSSAYLAGQEYSGQEWSAHLSHKEVPEVVCVFGNGKTPEEAMTNAIIDFHSKRRRIDESELSKFREWRAARERRGKRHLPYDKEQWDKAVSKQK